MSLPESLLSNYSWSNIAASAQIQTLTTGDRASTCSQNLARMRSRCANGT
ncbi:MAG: hypothetical protein AB1589_45990 [Cyanobacteriota bacterium]